jgi:hypothetical protein
VKSLLKTLLLILALNTYAQERVSISVLQDARLAVLGDDIGNDPFTPDFIVRLGMEGVGRFKYVSLRTEWEYADLAGGYYNRGSIFVGYNWLIDKLVVSTHIGPGIIKRRYMKASGGVLAFTFNADASYPLNDYISITIANQWTNRADVVNEPIRYSLFGGIKLYFKE